MRAIRLIAIIASTLLVALAGVALARTPGAANATHYHKHTTGCNTYACDVRVGRLWWRKHHSVPSDEQPTAFDLCVANRENGEPGSTEFGTIDWHADNNYEGAFSWEPSKWEAGGGLRFAPHPYEANPYEQIAVFHQNGRNGEWTANNWPTIPPCMGLPGSG